MNNEFDDYCNFDWDDPIAPYDGHIPCSESKKYEHFSYKLMLKSFLIIRNYVTKAVDPYNDNKTVDCEQLMNAVGQPVIPGTAWAGVFRKSFRRILSECSYDNADEIIYEIFGSKKTKNSDAWASNIIFSESVLEKAKGANRTRTAIDRFTGSAADKKLFTMRPVFGGTTTLEIRLSKKCKNKRLAENLIKLTVEDIDQGIVSVGGEASTGGGIFKLISEEGGKDERS